MPTMWPIKMRTALAFLLLAAPTALGAEPERDVLDVPGDSLPRHARMRLGSDRFRPGSTVDALRLAADGKTIITSADQVLRWWDADTGKELRHYKTTNAGILAPDGKTLAVIEVDPAKNIQNVRVWDTLTGKAGPPLGARQANVLYPCMAFSPDSKCLAVVERDNSAPGTGSIRLWDTASGKELHRLQATPPKEGQAPLFSPALCRFSPDGKMLAAVGGRGNKATLLIWDTTTGKQLPRPTEQPLDRNLFRDNRGRVNIQMQLNLLPSDGGLFIFSPDSKQIVAPIHATNGDGTNVTKLRCWDTATGKHLRDVGELAVSTTTLLFDPTGTLLAAVSQDNQTVNLFDAASGKAHPPAVLDNGVNALAFSADGKGLVLGGNLGVALLWDVAAGKERHELKSFIGQQNYNDNGFPITSQLLAFSPDGRTIVGSGGALVRRWTVATGKEIPVPGAGHEGSVAAVLLSESGKRLISVGADNTVRFWDIASGKQTKLLQGPRPDNFNGEYYSNDTTTLALTPDGKTLAIGWSTGALQLWDTVGDKELKPLKGHDYGISSLAFSSNGKALASAGADGRVFWWDIASGKIQRQYAGQPPTFDDIDVLPPTGPVQLALASDGRTLAITSVDDEQCYKLQLIELATGRQRRQFRVKAEPNVTQGAPPQLVLRGGLIVSNGNDPDGSGRVAFSPDGKTLAWTTGSVVRLWDVTRGRELRRFGVTEGSPIGAVFSPDGKYLSAASHDGTVYLWEAATGTVLGQFTGHRGAVQCVAFSADGTTLISGGADTTLLFWDVPGFLAAERPRTGDLSPARLTELWDRLSRADGEQADEARRELTAAPKQAVAFLRAQARPVPPVDAQHIDRLIAQLEDESAALRQKAEDELEKLGELAEPALQLRLTDHTRLTVFFQIDRLLTRASGPVAHPERMRTLRVIEVLEQIDTAEARAILQTVAEGAAESRLTQEARATLDRLASKKK